MRQQNFTFTSKTIELYKSCPFTDKDKSLFSQALSHLEANGHQNDRETAIAFALIHAGILQLPGEDVTPSANRLTSTLHVKETDKTISFIGIPDKRNQQDSDEFFWAKVNEQFGISDKQADYVAFAEETDSDEIWVYDDKTEKFL